MGENPSIDNQTIVEIGPDVNPIRNYLGWDSFKEIRQRYAYIAIDCDQEQLKKFKDMYGDAAAGDLEHLPLKSDSVDQICS